MKITVVYKRYKIMPNLQDHMLRVTAVASVICDSFKRPVDKTSVIKTALLHDIGNMVKFRLEAFPEFLEPEGLEYWSKIQREFIREYGADDYGATYKILKEIGVESKILSLIKSMEFRKAPDNAKHKNFEKKICQYSDLRVAPFGVLSLKQRLREVQNRFMRNKGINEQEFGRLAEGMRKIEQQIFSQTKIKPSYITDDKVNGEIESLKDFNLN